MASNEYHFTFADVSRITLQEDIEAVEEAFSRRDLHECEMLESRFHEKERVEAELREEEEMVDAMQSDNEPEVQNGNGDRQDPQRQRPENQVPDRAVPERIIQEHRPECDICHIVFASWKNLKRHNQTKHGAKGKAIKCDFCDTYFNRLDNKKTHMRNKHRAVNGDRGDSVQPGPADDTVQPGPSNNDQKRGKKIKCELCEETFTTQFRLRVHVRKFHRDHGIDKRRRLSDDTLHRLSESQELWTNENGEVDQELRMIYLQNMDIIQMEHQRGEVQDIFNFPLTLETLTVDFIRDRLHDIYRMQNSSFKVNFSFSFILRNLETGQYRFFYAHTNESALNEPFLIRREEDIEALIEQIMSLDVLHLLLKERDNSKWTVFRVVSIRFVVSRTHFPLGAGLELPPFIKTNRYIIGLDKDQKSGKIYEDRLCFFRCLSLLKYPKEGRNKYVVSEKATKELLQQWIDSGKCRTSTFKGIDISDIPQVEELYSVNINIYCLQEDASAFCLYISQSNYADVLYLNLYEDHLSYISDIGNYCRQFKCRNCKVKLFRNRRELNRHELSCKEATVFKYPGGYKSSATTVFDELEYADINIPHERRFYPYFITFDFEAMLVPCAPIQGAFAGHGESVKKLIWKTEHQPISVSVCSNVPEFTEERCFVNVDNRGLVVDMIEYMSEISKAACSIMEENFSRAFTLLSNRILDNDDPRREEIADNEPNDPDGKVDKLARTLFGKLSTYCSQIPTLGFNSARYDLNLIRKDFFKVLDERIGQFESLSVLKKGSAYSSVSTPDLLFLDISNFLAAGCSYDAFLKAYDCSARKGFFPYEWFDSPDKLEEIALPSYENFFSSLKNVNPLEEEHQRYSKLLKDGKTSAEALRQMKLQEIPKTGRENYVYLQDVWKQEGMKSFEDFLRWYNNLDVKPFVEAAEKLRLFYQQEGIDVFKQALSVPGIARQMVFKNVLKPTHFSLIDDRNADLHEKIKSNIVGGPSIIFKRFHEVGVTKIRGGENTCQNIVGYDANALYLWCFGQDMPTGPFIRRRRENQFAPEKRDRYLLAFRCLDYIAQSRRIHIIHKMNSATEKRIGPYPVDGFCAETGVVFQIDGCWFHGCHGNGEGCPKTLKQFQNEKTAELMRIRQERTNIRNEYIRAQGYQLEVIRECELLKNLKTDKDMKAFFQKYRKPLDRYSTMTEQQIVDFVSNGRLFGMVECDIHVPTHLKAHFSEMSPIFKNIEIPMDAIGEHMQNHAERFGLSKKPRRSLIGSMKAEKILLATPLLQWYLKQGLQITKIYEVIEYERSACFKPFMEKVSDARRKGDEKEEYAIMADTMKLIGNSSYGSMIMDKEKHKTTVYVNGKHNAHLAINDKRFRKISELGDSLFEVEYAKSRINMDLPNQIGFFILQYAKLRMLDFYYNLVDKYVPRSCFEYLEMDTDSAYLAISGKTLESVIPPNIRGQFEKEKHLWFPRTSTAELVAHDRRTPGLFKVEFEGDIMISLCSKLYCIVKKDGNNSEQNGVTKFSCKGVRKSELKSPIEIYREVLKSEKSHSATNKGFRLHEGLIKTYHQTKIGVVYFYPKRKVLADGISTIPLDI